MMRRIQILLMAGALALVGAACTERDRDEAATDVEQTGESVGERLEGAGDRAERGMDSVVRDVRGEGERHSDVAGDPERSRFDEEREERAN